VAQRVRGVTPSMPPSSKCTGANCEARLGAPTARLGDAGRRGRHGDRPRRASIPRVSATARGGWKRERRGGEALAGPTPRPSGVRRWLVDFLPPLLPRSLEHNPLLLQNPLEVIKRNLQQACRKRLEAIQERQEGRPRGKLRLPARNGTHDVPKNLALGSCRSRNQRPTRACAAGHQSGSHGRA
jgi:hypothetical protein